MPTIPNLPTDNLYKFSFLGGLTIVIFAIFLISTKGESIREKLNIFSLEIAKYNSETVSITKELVQLEKENTKLESDIGNVKHNKGDYNQYITVILSKLNDKIYREYISFISEHENIIFPYNAQIDKLDVKSEKIKEKMNQVSLNIDIINVRNKQLDLEFIYYCILLIVVIALEVLGFSIAINGRKGWVKFQNIADEKNAIELSILKLQLKKMETDELNHSVNLL